MLKADMMTSMYSGAGIQSFQQFLRHRQGNDIPLRQPSESRHAFPNDTKDAPSFTSFSDQQPFRYVTNSTVKKNVENMRL